MSRTISTRRFTLQVLIFWVIWLLVQLTLNSPIEHHLTGWSEELALDAVKLIIWVGGALWFLHRAHPEELAISPREQWRPNWHFTAGYVIWAVIVVYLLAEFALIHHGLRISPSFTPEYWGRYFLVVGVAEEFLFRGYFFNVLLKKFSLTRANTIQALAFACLHIPRYLTTVPAMSPATWIGNLVTVAALGALFGWLYAKSRSLWPGIIVHMTWDILVTLFG
ncbi:CPBP family intramembrane metalloprotease [Levilactobacillus brevis]|uniref:CPBP family intramembrane metalloprotease n=1 Tax=Levilactobacillus hammesii TaxID=267633 RepID=A0A921JX90_9LACO|nr:CPBP family intramembrane metalloprotease [Levilactobacillus brevis]HJE86562.1 CPBP family intramembrane metalloprotease [Levilactobacillus hammesii]